MKKNIFHLRNQIMNQALIVFTVLVLINMVFMVIRVVKFGVTKLFIINILLCFTIIATAILRKRIHLYIKLEIVGISAYIALVNGLSNIGFLASAKV